MLTPRVIPCLLIGESGLVKTTRFESPTYVGDPINTVRLFNDKDVDEIIVLDISIARSRSAVRSSLLADLAGECFVPLCYGGGISSLDQAARVLEMGFEKISVNTAAMESPGLVSAAADRFGSQSVVLSVDFRRVGRRDVVFTHAGRVSTGLDPVEHARRGAELGAGEILLTSIDREGTGTGYDIEMIRRVVDAVEVPVVAHGGAGSADDLRRAFGAGASAAAAGSLFVFKGRHRAVLISYPSPEERRSLAAPPQAPA